MEFNENSIEACRTCGTYFFTSSNLLRHLFPDPTNDTDLELIRLQLNAWNVEIHETDGFPQTICTGCILEFQKIFKFRRTCIETQEHLRFLNNLREKNIQIKTEIPDPEPEDKFCGFIYVDDISDDEENAPPVTPFNFPHIPIKEEIMSEDATVPEQNFMTNNNCNQTQETTMSENMLPVDELENKDIKPDIKLLEAQTASSNAIKSPSTTIKCKLCTHCAPNPTALNKHIQLAHEVKDHECHVCGKLFKSSTAMRLKFHLKWHKLSKHIKCGQCGFYCASRYLLNEHKRAVHAKLHCEICNKQFTAKKLKMHMREHELSEDYLCMYCDQVFQTDSERQQHIWHVHSTDADSFDEDMTYTTIICAKCNQTFKSTDELQCHVQQDHSYESVNTLNSFDKLEASTASMNINQKHPKNTQSDDDEDYQINQEDNFTYNEGASFMNMQQVSAETSAESLRNDGADDEDQDLIHNELNHALNNQHSTVIDDDEIQQFGCALCPETFRTIEELLAHHLDHTKQQTEFKCTICNKTFKLMVLLKRHLKKHDRAPF